MRSLRIELQKEKRAGVIPLLTMAGVLGALYVYAGFEIRKDTLLKLPVAPMDVLLTQMYGMTMILNMFGMIVAACMIYGLEFKGNAVRKMYMLPVRVSTMYLCKFLILTVMLLLVVCLQNLVLAGIGVSDLPEGSFEFLVLLRFAGYSFITSMPVLSFMLLIASRFENIWVPLGVGVAGFLTGMALVTWNLPGVWIHPFVAMLKPAVAMSAQPDGRTIGIALAETAGFLGTGLWMSEKLRYE